MSVLSTSEVSQLSVTAMALRLEYILVFRFVEDASNIACQYVWQCHFFLERLCAVLPSNPVDDGSVSSVVRLDMKNLLAHGLFLYLQ